MQNGVRRHHLTDKRDLHQEGGLIAGKLGKMAGYGAGCSEIRRNEHRRAKGAWHDIGHFGVRPAPASRPTGGGADRGARSVRGRRGGCDPDESVQNHGQSAYVSGIVGSPAPVRDEEGPHWTCGAQASPTVMRGSMRDQVATVVLPTA